MPETHLTLDQIRRAPKVLLHDHLDGGLRPATVIELADAVGYEDLPAKDPDELSRWFVTETPRRNLVRYLEGFAQLYTDLAEQIHARLENRSANPAALLVPGIADGVEGIRFISAVLESSRKDSCWTSLASAK